MATNWENPAQCSFEANTDLYGLGVRLGIYLQWVAQLWTTIVKPGEEKAVLIVNLLLQCALLLGIILLSAHGAASVLDPIITFWLLFGALSSMTGDGINPLGKATGTFRVLFYTAIAGFYCWFWFVGLNRMLEVGCDPTVFFGGVSARGRFAAFAKAISIMALVACFVLLLLCWYYAPGTDTEIKSEDGIDQTSVAEEMRNGTSDIEALKLEGSKRGKRHKVKTKEAVHQTGTAQAENGQVDEIQIANDPVDKIQIEHNVAQNQKQQPQNKSWAQVKVELWEAQAKEEEKKIKEGNKSKEAEHERNLELINGELIKARKDLADEIKQNENQPGPVHDLASGEEPRVWKTIRARINPYLLCLSVCIIILSISSVEYLIKVNDITGAHEVESVGQLIALLAGVFSLVLG